tara:strand:- start:3411 stop:3644 length:234 start_codon:yes stop_codon:yes gene_type:complete
MCFPSVPDPVETKLPPPPPPPPEKPPEAIADATDSTSEALKKKKKSAQDNLGRGSSGVQTAGTKTITPAATSGLTIG